MRRSCLARFSQHRTPVLPQAPVHLAAPHKVAYLLCRQPVVKPAPHPLETEFGFTLEREHSRYARHDAETSQFFAARGQAIDVANRSDPAQIQANFFNLEGYQDAQRVVVDRFQPVPRVTPHDFVDLAALDDAAPPTRRHIQRRLDDFLLFISRSAETGRWGLPCVERRGHETLRMAVERAVSEHHNDALDVYFWSNAPQAVVRGARDLAESSPADVAEGNAENNTFIFVATYLSGRPHFAGLTPRSSDHAWVTRAELCHYDGEFESADFCQILRDIAPDAQFTSNP